MSTIKVVKLPNHQFPSSISNRGPSLMSHTDIVGVEDWGLLFPHSSESFHRSRVSDLMALDGQKGRQFCLFFLNHFSGRGEATSSWLTRTCTAKRPPLGPRTAGSVQPLWRNGPSAVSGGRVEWTAHEIDFRPASNSSARVPRF